MQEKTCEVALQGGRFGVGRNSEQEQKIHWRGRFVEHVLAKKEKKATTGAESKKLFWQGKVDY